MRDRYYFGTLARQVDFFAFPRTGSHFFNYCTSGLFDLVALPTPGIDNSEAVSRQQELDPAVLEALAARQDGVPYQPVIINQRATGQHGDPARGEHPVVVLIRDPMATVYSYYNAATSRWGAGERIKNVGAWAEEKFGRYHRFYTRALEVLRTGPGILIRFEDLAAGPGPLHDLVRLVGVRPKLEPDLVHRLTRFDSITRPGARTFYRAGDNDAWSRDAAWRGVVPGAPARLDFGAFGYGVAVPSAPA
ncbi:MAG: hypothetical protein IT437_10550 [Phycisphaerales bacterium]|nr:hypothetical protein [Phycisphaerales bacterium]